MPLIAPSFRPLYSFVAVAIRPPAGLAVTGGGGGSSVPVNTVPVSLPAEGPLEDRHRLAPQVEVALLAADEDVSPYAPQPRYCLMAKDSGGATWVSLNAVSDEMPPPPSRRSGPIDCSCANVDGVPGPRYSEVQEDSWRFNPTWFDLARLGLPYIPDLFGGAGPCFARDYTGLLQQWDDAWIVDNGGKLSLRGDVASHIEHCDSIDISVMTALELRTAADSVPPPSFAYSKDDLKRQWDRFVGVTQERRGRILERLARGSRWERFREEYADLWYDLNWVGYYSFAPIGVWIRDTPAQAKKIQLFIEEGVPVYYLWKPEFWTTPGLETLRPRFAYAPKTPPGSPPEYHPVNKPAVSDDSSRPEGTNEEPRKSDEFPEEQNTEFWDEAVCQLDATRTDERATARASLRSPPPLLTPRSPTVAHSINANRAPLVPKSVVVRKDTLPAGGHATAAQPLIVDKTAGELFTLVPTPLKLCLNNARSSSGHLQRLVSDALTGSPDEAVTGPEVCVRDGIAEANSLPALERRMQGGRELPRLFVYDILSVKMKIHAFLTGRRSPTDELRLMQFFISVNIQYVSGVTVPKANVDHVRWERNVREELWLKTGEPHYTAYQHWRRNISELLATPRIARAVRARGGLIARITKYEGSVLDVWREPTSEVYAFGSPRSIEHTGVVYYGDWLDDDEAQVFVGAAGKAGPGVGSLFPPVDVFDKLYDGFWSETWESWFSKRVDEIKKGTPGPKLSESRSGGLCKEYLVR
ncbi:hypothetical protein AURDEDRAFT_173425 [Auricularia subglabra TFB-10046 SS5]|nr:hypothetical protein AURDEDRAFT_173425 [Auricularia subglabra TFB-10046 SS5]